MFKTACIHLLKQAGIWKFVCEISDRESSFGGEDYNNSNGVATGGFCGSVLGLRMVGRQDHLR